jgi:alginate O-acetyltransferase complex protein AlgJ
VQAPRLALVGTSYSAQPSWNFHGALQEALGEDVGNYAKEGLGPFAPMFEYLRSKDFAQAPPRLVLWEIPERYLVTHQPLEEYQLPAEAFKVRARKIAPARQVTASRASVQQRRSTS